VQIIPASHPALFWHENLLHQLMILKFCTVLQYPINKTPIKFNLTNMEQTSRISRVALLALVDWVTKQKKSRSELIEGHGVGDGSTSMSLTIDKPVGDNGDESTEQCVARSINQ
jgi:hypothetical protein